MDEAWFKWVVGGMFSLGSATLGWNILNTLAAVRDLQKQISELGTKVAVLEDRPRVDPAEMAEIRHDLKNLKAKERGPGR